MSRIITISRNFGSGGREVGKRLADKLGYAYYDKEIIDEVSSMSGLDADYIEKFSESGFSRFYNYTFARSFHSYTQSPTTKVWIAQNKVLKQLAEKGSCVIVGRCTDVVLKENNPLKVFIYSSEMNSRIKRCYQKVPAERDISSTAIENEIIRIDKERSKYYKHYTGEEWGKMGNYNLCIDTSVIDIKSAVKIIVSLS